MVRKITLAVVLLCALVLPLSLLNAQSSFPVVADQLNAPRQLFVTEAGSLFVAEAGAGGPYQIESNFGPALGGGSAAVTLVSPEGVQTNLLYGLHSRNAGGEFLGASALMEHDGVLWLALGQGDLRAPFSQAVVALDPETFRVQQFIDVYGAEAAQNPDAEIVDSNVVDLAVIGDSLYIVDAGCNCVWTRSLEPSTDFAALDVAQVWQEGNPVPTSITPDDEGGYYIGFLTGFPFPENGSRIEHYNAAGELVETFEGLTAVVDVLYADGTLYATEFGRFGEQGWTPGTGRVVTVSAAGVTPVAEGLNFPYGLAMVGDALLVAINASYSQPGTGAVIVIQGETSMAQGGLPDPTVAPTATPTAEMTAEPTEEPTDEMTPEPTPEVTDVITDEPPVEPLPTDEITIEPPVEPLPTDEITIEPPVETPETQPGV